MLTIDMVANYPPELMETALFSDEPNLKGVALTGLEALAAYSLQADRLIQFVDGSWLPRCCTGVAYKLDGEWIVELGLQWNNEDKVVEITWDPLHPSSAAKWAVPAIKPTYLTHLGR